MEILNTCEIQGYTIFYYGNFFEKFRVLLTEHHVFSPEMLRIVLQSIAPDYLYAKAYFTISETGTSEQEIRKYFACNEQGMLVQDLIGRLPFIPEDVIRSALHQNDYTWVREGVYVWNEQILLDEDEVKRVKGRVIHDIELNGFAVLTNYDFPESFDNCLQLSMSAVRNAFYKSALQESFERSGNLLLPKGKKISIVTMMEEFCTKHEIVDKAELIALEQDLTGNNIHRAIEVACQKMMRVSKDRFIQKNAILFDVMKVDQCLDAYVRNRVIPLQAVKSFTGFPLPSNYIWNLFLLESFCRHVSKKYRFQCASPNDRNLGAIYPVALQLENYIDVLARAVFEAKIPITEEEVANYLIEQGFLSRKTATIKKVINKAQQLDGKGA